MLEDEVRNKINKLKESLNKINSKSENKKKTYTKWYETQNKTIGATIEFLAPIILGVFLGIYLDKKFTASPFFILMLTILGFITGIYNLVKLGKK